MSGYLGSIGFALPAALGASVAVRRSGSGRKVVSISGDGGLGQYLAEVTTAVKEGFPLTHIVLDNGELAKISREQLGAIRPVWQTDLVNPDFAELAKVFGIPGMRAETPDALQGALREALATDGPVLIEVPIGPVPAAGPAQNAAATKNWWTA